ncbi:MAG: T9SS type A sorting domain-containing protein [Ignavibacteria bacterium]|nr:T9SS type A sorting domain-containing protein [Ignavibacteria bacterium]
MKSLISSLKVLLFAIIVLINFQNSYGQYQERSYDVKCGAVSGTEFGRSITNRIDDGYAIAGYSYNPLCGIGPFDWLFLKVRSTGVHESVRMIGTTFDDKCYSLVQTLNDSGYVLAGNMYDASKQRATFVKLDKSSALSYSKRLDDPNNSQYMQVILDPNKNLGFTGWDEKNLGDRLRNKLLVSQYDQLGVRNWIYRYNSYVSSSIESGSTEEAYSICFQSAGTSYGVAARTNYFSATAGIWDIMVVKLSYTGSVIWNKVYRFNFPSSSFYPSTEPRKIIPMSDGGFVVVGFTNAYVQSEKDIIVFRVNASGGLMWSRTYGSTAFIEEGNSIVLDGSHLVVTGSRRRSTTSNNALLMKIPVTGGAPIWTRIWDATTPEADAGFDLVKSNVSVPDGYAITGETYRGTNSFDPFLWRTNVNGIIPSTNCQDSTVLQIYNNPHKIDSMILIKWKLGDKQWTPGIVTPGMNTKTICLGPADSPTGMQEDNINDITEFNLNQNYPNPFNPSTTIKYDVPEEAFVTIKIFDVAGKEIFTLVNENKSYGRYEIEFSGADLSTGVYYYRLTAGNFTEIRKMILLK